MINNKGMTLVEEIVALAIISIASLKTLVGFSTAANVFADSTRYKIYNE
ncbi:MAG: type II secretion system protein [Thomasclavelia ramosa]